MNAPGNKLAGVFKSALMLLVLASTAASPALLTLPALSEAASDYDHTYSSYGKALHKYVSDGLVNYSGLKSDPDSLDVFLNQAALVTREEYRGWSREEQLAFLINLYNAATLQLVANNYPVKSIKEINAGEEGPWEKPVVRLFNEAITLNTLENTVIRKNFDEPRIHFALVCAARGCPPLISEPYLPETLDEQLDKQTRLFLSNPEKNRIDGSARTAVLSPVFKWYAEDFERRPGSVGGFINLYTGGGIKDGYDILYSEYDWTLNDMKAR